MSKLFGQRQAEMPFLDHLEELRWRILWSLAALLGGVGIGFWLVMRFDVLGLLIRPIKPYLPGERLGYLSPADPFMLTLKLALIVGVILAFPVIVYHVWSFVSPALTKEEKRSIVPALYMGLVLFAVGVAGAYFLALPATLSFFMGFQVEALTPTIIAPAYLGFVTKLLLAFGVLFELPVVILILSSLGLVSAGWLRSKRRYAIALGAVAASLITPGDVVLLTAFMMIPLMLLYEMSIGLAALVERRRRRLAREREAEEAERAPDEWREGDPPGDSLSNKPTVESTP